MNSTNRYHRQMLLPAMGEAGQAKLQSAQGLILGCGALGTVLADQLVRAGIGSLRIADRDIVELTNLQRQNLFDEADARDGIPKAVAAAARLRAVNSQVKVQPIVMDVHAGNVEELIGLLPADRVNVILDGTDNAQTRYLLNDVAVKHSIPWIYVACIGTEGRAMVIRPGQTPCLRCVFPDAPAPGELPTCDTAGVLGPAVGAIASFAAASCIQLLVGQSNSAALTTLDVWSGRSHQIKIGVPLKDCHCCGLHQFEFLDRAIEDSTIQLCGQDAIQIRPLVSALRGDSLETFAARLATAGRIQQTDFLVRCWFPREDRLSLTVFADGRAIIQGTRDFALARSIYSRYIGG